MKTAKKEIVSFSESRRSPEKNRPILLSSVLVTPFLIAVMANLAAAQVPVRHPHNPKINRISFTHFGGPPRGKRGRRRSTVVVEPGRLDRSPCGTGTMAKMAVLHARGELKVGETLYHESVTGTYFLADIIKTTKIGRTPAIVPRVSGRAWVSAVMEIGHDPSDPFPEGFTLTDTWGSGDTDVVAV